MVNVTEHFASDFQEFKASTAERINKIERIIWENVIGHDTVQAEDIKQQVKLLKNENNRLRMEPESLLKVIELLSVQQVHTLELTTTQKLKKPVKTKKPNLTYNRITEFH